MPCPNNPLRAPGTWCNVPSGPAPAKTVCTLLQEILQIAQQDAAAQPAQISPALLAQVNTLTTECHFNAPPTPALSGAAHVQKVKDARAAAGLHNWQLCVSHLDHGH